MFANNSSESRPIELSLHEGKSLVTAEISSMREVVDITNGMDTIAAWGDHRGGRSSGIGKAEEKHEAVKKECTVPSRKKEDSESVEVAEWRFEMS